MSRDPVPEEKRRLPAWLLGLIIALFVFALVLFLFSVLGYGDDPVVDSLGNVMGA